MKHFLLRACHNILPTRVNLYKQKIIDHINCHIYNQNPKTTAHSRLECLVVNDVRREESNPPRKWVINPPNMKDLQTDIMDKLSITNQEFYNILLNNIQYKHKTFNFDNQFASPKYVPLAAKLQLEAYQTSTLHEE